MDKKQELGKADVVKVEDTVDKILSQNTERLSREIRKVSIEIGYPIYCSAAYTDELWLCRGVEDTGVKLALRKDGESLRARLSRIFGARTFSGSLPGRGDKANRREALVGVLRLENLGSPNVDGNAPWSLEVFGENNLPHLRKIMSELEAIHGRNILVELTGDEIRMATIAEYNAHIQRQDKAELLR
jgi:hypothetical protein